MVKNDFKEQYISSQWGSFLEHAILNLDKSIRVYDKNKESDRNKGGVRKLIAESENASASIAVLSLVTSLEGFTNAYAFIDKVKNYDTWNDLPTKLQKIGVSDSNIITAATELTVCRDSITHGHIWLKNRTSDDNTYELKEIRSFMWKPFKNSLKPKFRNNVDWKSRTTKALGLNVIPIDISLVDGIKALKIASSIHEDYYGKVHMNWRPVLYPHHQEGFSKETQEALHEHHYLTDWVRYFEGILNNPDSKEYIKNTKNLP